MSKFGNFVGQIRTEMGKVAWPSKDELMASTIVVLVATFLMAIYIGICDAVLSKTLHFLISGIVF
jgi:preprotein translocase subunit SecE